MSVEDALVRQRALIAKVSELLGPTCVWHETHISLVLVAGGFAYKFKKAVRFDFLDFSSLERRRYYCQEELRLNTRFAPGIYLDVVPVTGTPDHPVIAGQGEALEYAIRMRAFDQASLWSVRIEQNRLTGTEIDALSENLAQFHALATCSPADSPWCTPHALRSIADETIDQISVLLPSGAECLDAVTLREWEWHQRNNLFDTFMRRKAAGFIRECHGDLHCGNVLTIDSTVEAFDCIEFNDSLRWIDVMNDIAFTCMDLRSKGLSHFAARLLSRYLEFTGDYDGLRVFSYYEVHRALIRCKVSLLRAAQTERLSPDRVQASDQALAYFSFARRRLDRPCPAIIITHGFSGSGKSTLARMVVEAVEAVQLRSDVERKRLYGMASLERGGAEIYTQDVSDRVYERLADLARSVVEAGWIVVVDATFLERQRRALFASLAGELGVHFLILDAVADLAEIRNRLLHRERAHTDASDAGLAILEQQLACHDPFSAEEISHVLTVDSAKAEIDALGEMIEKRFI